MDKRIEESKTLRSLGLTLTPLKGKNAYLKSWPSLEYTDAMWDTYHGQRGTNFGLVLGDRSLNVVCIDIDPRNGGHAWEKRYQSLLDESGVIEESGRGDGGRHYFFRSEGGLKNCCLADGIDFLSTGKQVALAPSIHPDTGKEYFRVKGSLSNLFFELTNIPERLLDMIVESGARKTRESQTPFDVPDEITTADRTVLLDILSKLKKPANNSHHNTISGWVTDAVLCGMPDADIVYHAEQWVVGNRGVLQDYEIENWVAYAKENHLKGEAYISTYSLMPDRITDEFEPVPELIGKPDPNGWKKDMNHRVNQRTKIDDIYKSLFNIQKVIECHPDLKGKFAYNEMSQTVIKYGDDKLPWDSPADRYGFNAHVGEIDIGQMHSWFSKTDELYWEVTDSDMGKALVNASRLKIVHPIRDWLFDLEWDGVKRMDEMLYKVTRCDDTEYHKQCSAYLMLSIVARIVHPGCKQDNCIILEGLQGNGKSTFCSTLAGDQTYFVDEIGDVKDSKETVEKTNGALIVELQEIDKFFNKFSASHLKTWLSMQKEKTRLAYGRAAVTIPRSFTAIGTTNLEEYLIDGTGERRYLCVKTGNDFFDIEYLKEFRDQIFAEAYDRLNRDGVAKSLTMKRDFVVMQTQEHEERKQIDPWYETIEKWVLAKSVNVPFTTEEILYSVLSIPHHGHTYKDKGRVKRTLQLIGCRETRKKHDSSKKRLRVWHKPFGEVEEKGKIED